MIRPIIADQDGICLIGVLTDARADELAGGGILITEPPLILGGQGHDLTEAEDAAWFLVGVAVCAVGVALGTASLLVWPVGGAL